MKDIKMNIFKKIITLGLCSIFMPLSVWTMEDQIDLHMKELFGQIQDIGERNYIFSLSQELMKKDEEVFNTCISLVKKCCLTDENNVNEVENIMKYLLKKLNNEDYKVKNRLKMASPFFHKITHRFTNISEILLFLIEGTHKLHGDLNNPSKLWIEHNRVSDNQFTFYINIVEKLIDEETINIYNLISFLKILHYFPEEELEGIAPKVAHHFKGAFGSEGSFIFEEINKTPREKRLDSIKEMFSISV
jgi:hypothetical protein